MLDLAKLDELVEKAPVYSRKAAVRSPLHGIKPQLRTLIVEKKHSYRQVVEVLKGAGLTVTVPALAKFSQSNLELNRKSGSSRCDSSKSEGNGGGAESVAEAAPSEKAPVVAPEPVAPAPEEEEKTEPSEPVRLASKDFISWSKFVEESGLKIAALIACMEEAGVVSDRNYGDRVILDKIEYFKGGEIGENLSWPRVKVNRKLFDVLGIERSS